MEEEKNKFLYFFHRREGWGRGELPQGNVINLKNEFHLKMFDKNIFHKILAVHIVLLSLSSDEEQGNTQLCEG